MSTRKPKPKPGAEAKRVVIKSRQWETGPDREVDLIEFQFSDTEWEVYLTDGTWIGTIGRYTGSLDRKYAGSRIRHPGKRRTLWHEKGTHKDARTLHGEVSRADAIRDLLRAHEQRGRGW